jgi:Rhodopirellula transposase DDE domain
VSPQLAPEIGLDPFQVSQEMTTQSSMNWHGQPLMPPDLMSNLIANTRTRSGLRIRAELDPALYPTGVKVTDEEFMAIHLEPDVFHGNWNYAILPKSSHL